VLSICYVGLRIHPNRPANILLSVCSRRFELNRYDAPAFFDVGPAASSAFPEFIDVPSTDYWDQTSQPCEQEQFRDYTGVDSLASFLVCLLLFLSVQFLEFRLGRALFNYGGGEAYIKDTTEHPIKGARKSRVGVPMADFMADDDEEGGEGGPDDVDELPVEDEGDAPAEAEEVSSDKKGFEKDKDGGEVEL